AQGTPLASGFRQEFGFSTRVLPALYSRLASLTPAGGQCCVRSVGRGDDQALVVRQRSTALTKRGPFVGRGDEGAQIYHVQVAERNVAVGRIARQPEHLHDDQLAGATAAGQHLELVVRALGDR